MLHIYKVLTRLFVILVVMQSAACVPNLKTLEPKKELPDAFLENDTISSGDHSVATRLNWKEYFTDQSLLKLIDTALANNQELNILTQEVLITQNEIGAKQGAYLPEFEIGIESGLDKVGEFTRNGVIEAEHEIEPGKKFPDPLPEFKVGTVAKWEVDIWKKLRNAEKSAIKKYLATVEGRNFMMTNLVAEIANLYFELLALDNQLTIVKKNIDIQTDALGIVELKKQGARVTELALKRFQAQLFKTKSLQYAIQQQIVLTENKINFLVGRYPQHILRKSETFKDFFPEAIQTGIPSNLLENRPDIRQAELELEAANIDVKVARARFYPSLNITGGFGYSAYNTSKLLESPESMIYSIGGGLTAPILNRKEIKAMYLNAGAKQVQAVIQYERTLLQAYTEVSNQISNIDNLRKKYDIKSKEVKALDDSVEIASTLFNSARADYMEVLLTQREAMDSKFELVETRVDQLRATVGIYRALGGGWNKKAPARNGV